MAKGLWTTDHDNDLLSSWEHFPIDSGAWLCEFAHSATRTLMRSNTYVRQEGLLHRWCYRLFQRGKGQDSVQATRVLPLPLFDGCRCVQWGIVVLELVWASVKSQ